jgi:hypothetical protein
MATADRAAFIADEGDAFLTAANVAGKIEWFETDNDEDNDAVNDPDVVQGYTWTGYDAGAAGSNDAFSHLNDLAPFLTGYELQVLEEWYLNQEADLKSQIANAAEITASQLQAVFDALKNPQID